MTEEIINALSQIPGLKVTARTSSFVYKHKKQDIRTIGKELGVALVLEGSVRTSGERVRVTAQLVQANDGFHIWSEKFDKMLQDIFDLQDEISLLIAGKIREHFGHLAIQDRLVHVATDNIEAYQLYLKGRHAYNKWDMPNFVRAAEWYQQSIEADPAFDLPYYGAGLSYSFLGSWGGMERETAFQRAEDFFERGDQLGRSSAYRHYSVAKHLFWGHWDFKAAYETLLKAYASQPEDADTNEFMAEIHTLAGRFSTALQHIDKSISVDPLAANHFYTKANIYYLQGQFKASLQAVNKGLSLSPGYSLLLEFKLANEILLGEGMSPSGNTFELWPLLSRLYSVLSKLVHGGTVADDVVQDAIDSSLEADPPLLFAWPLYLFVHAGNLDEAMRLVEEGVSSKQGPLINLKYDPFLQPLHDMQGFQDLIHRHFSDGITIHETKPPSERALLTSDEADHLAVSVVIKMEEEKYYLDAALSLRSLAEKIDLHPNKLSWLLNNKLGKNFYEFINGYRLKEFQQRALDPKNKAMSLLGLAYDSGFNSKSVFNDYFKKTTGMTPKAWVNERKGVH